MFHLRLLVCALVLAASPAWANGVEPPEAALDHLDTYFRTFERCVLAFEVKATCDDHQLKNEHRQTYSGRLYRDLPRWREMGSTETFVPPVGKGNWTWQREEFEHVFDGQKSFTLPLEKGKPDRGIIAWTEIPADYPSAYRGPSYPHLPFLEGRIGYNYAQPLLTILRDSTVTTRAERGESGELLVIEASGRWGRHTIWMDPGRGYVPVKILQRKAAKDWIRPQGKLLEEAKHYVPGDPTSRAFTATATATRIETQGDRHVVTGYTMVYRNELSNGATFTDTYTGTLSEVELDPKFAPNAFSLQTKLSDGLPVYVQNEPAMRYEIQDGQLVRTFDPNAAQSGLAARFLNNRWLARSVVALAVLLAVAGGVIWVRRRQRRRSA